MVSTEEVARAQAELSLTEADSLSASTLTKLRQNLGSDIVAAGSYAVIAEGTGQRVRVDLRLQDAVAGETILETAANGSESDLFELVSRIGTDLREKLGVGATSGSDATSARASMPSNPEAARLYSEGLAKLRAFDPLTARDLLQEAVATEPNHALSHSALASAWADLGYEKKATEEARRALSLSGKRTKEEQLWMEGTYREMTHDWERAQGSYRTLFALFPDNLEYGLRLAHAQYRGSKGPETLATLQALRKLPEPGSNDPRIDLTEAYAHALLSDDRQRLQAALRAAGKAELHGARLLQARALVEKGRALENLGENTQALASFVEAKEIFAAAGDRKDLTHVLLYTADVASEQGDYPSALALYHQVLAIDREIGDVAGTAPALNNMADVYESRGDFATAQKMYEQALAIYRETDNKASAAIVLQNIAEVLFYRGNLAAAESRYRQAFVASEEVGDPTDAAGDLQGIAMVLAAKGDLPGARAALARAFPMWQSTGYMHGTIAGLHTLGEIQMDEGDLVAARKTEEEALAMSQKLGEKGSIAESKVGLATLFLEEGRHAEAETAAQAAATEFQTEQVPDLEAVAFAIIAQSYAEQAEPRFAAAQAAIDRAAALSVKSQEPIVRLFIDILAARVRASATANSATGRVSAAETLRRLQADLTEAERFGFFGRQLEARLAMGKIEVSSGLVHAGRRRLAFLEKAARAKGYDLIARKAAAIQ